MSLRLRKAFCSIALFASVVACAGPSQDGRPLEFEVRAAGRPVEYATIGAMRFPDERELPESRRKTDRRYFERLLGPQLQGWEMWNKFAGRPEGLLYVGMTDANGRWSGTFDCGFLADVDEKPASMSVLIGIYRRGFHPVILERTVPCSDEQMALSVNLENDGSGQGALDPLVRELFEIRYLIGCSECNALMTLENASRLEGIRARLEDLVKRAKAQRKPAIAAEALYWQAYAPSVRVHGGKVTGFAQTDSGSGEFRVLMEEAARLAPENQEIQTRYYGYAGVDDRHQRSAGTLSVDEMIARRIARWHELQSLVERLGDSVNPWLMGGLAAEHSFFQCPSRQLAALDLLASIDPQHPEFRDPDNRRMIENIRAHVKEVGPEKADASCGTPMFRM